jgi:hypothetical protein
VPCSCETFSLSFNHDAQDLVCFGQRSDELLSGNVLMCRPTSRMGRIRPRCYVLFGGFAGSRSENHCPPIPEAEIIVLRRPVS